MPTCDHFIYTTAKTETRKGYQVIAKSKGITDSIISNFTNYLYPLGVNPVEFKKSKSLFILGKNKIAYSIVKNIGKGYDGREGTLYNHTIIMTVDDFEKLDNDSRVFDEHFIDDYFIRGELKQLYIQPTHIPLNFSSLEKLHRNILSAILYGLFRKRKIAIVDIDNEELIQNILSIIPPKIRLVPFSTLVYQPERQAKYNFIQIPNRIQPKLSPNFMIINPLEAETISKRQLGSDVGIQKLVDVILEHDEKSLRIINKDFEKMSDRFSKSKRIQLSEIFTKSEFENLCDYKKFETFEHNVRKLYNSSEFNQASPRIMLTISKKIRNMVKKSLKKQEKISYEQNKDNVYHLISVIKILLDCMNYIQEFSEKRKGNTLENEISLEIVRLKEIIVNNPVQEITVENYVFDPYEYVRTKFEQAVQIGWSVYLWMSGQKW